MAQPTTAPRYRGVCAVYVQAWNCTSKRLGIRQTVYSREIMLDRMGDGWDVESTTIIRFDDGRREYHDGTMAVAVYAYREGRSATEADLVQ